MYTGPKIVRDGLVFGYDADDRSSRFYKGEPAVNCATKLGGNGWGTGGYTVVDITDGSIKPPREGALVQKITFTADPANIRFGGYYQGGGFGGVNAAPLLLGRTDPSNYTTVGTGKYKFGFWVRGESTNSNNDIQIDIGDRNGAAVTVNNNTNWQFVSTTDAEGINNTTVPYDFFDILFMSTAGNVYYISDLMIVRSPGTVDNLPILQTYPQFVDYGQERTYVSSLIDLKKNTSINLNNVSFDSTAHPYFDGSDDKIQTTYAPQFGDFTICLVFKDDGTGTWGRLIDKSFSEGVFISSYFDSGGVNYVGAGIIEPNYPHGQSLPYTPGQYHFFTVTRLGSTHTVYLDGTSQTLSKTGSSNLLSSTSFAFGAWSGSNNQPFKGSLPVVLIYSKALSVDEIQQNYNAVKNRYNI